MLLDPVECIHVHEDDEGMRNLYPIEALPAAANDVEQAAIEGEQNRDPNGAGWTAMHVIERPKSDYASAGLLLSRAESAIEPLLPRVRVLISSATGPDNDPHCFGFDEECLIKLVPEGDLVRAIWYDCRAPEPDRIAALRASIEAIDALAPSSIADYCVDMSGAVRDKDFLDSYFRELAELAAL